MAARKAEPATVQSDFGGLLADVRNRIQSAQVRAVLAVSERDDETAALTDGLAADLA